MESRLKKIVRAASLAAPVALSLVLSALFASCAGYRPFVDSSPAPAEEMEISGEGWNGSASTEIAEPDRPVGVEEAREAEGNAGAGRITF